MNMVAMGPVAVAIDASPAFCSYKSGVFTGPCDNNITTINHAVTVVGYQQDLPGSPGYWIIRNSWKASWGDKGFAKVGISNNTCSVTTLAFSVAL